MNTTEPESPDDDLRKQIQQLERQLTNACKTIKDLEERVQQLEAIVEPGPRRVVGKLCDRVNRSLDGRPDQEIPRRRGPQIE